MEVTGKVWGAKGSTSVEMPDDYSHEAYPDLARARLVMALAGIAVEDRLAGTTDLAGARGDLETAFEITDALAFAPMPPGVLLRECQDEARQIVGERWQAIEGVASALIESPRSFLDEKELRRAAKFE
jgi:hypothetical protein